MTSQTVEPTLLQTDWIEGPTNKNDESTQLYPIRLWQVGNVSNPPPTDTIVIIHGRSSKASDGSQPIDALFPRLYTLATELAIAPSTQILLIDAQEALTDPDLPPYSAASRIQAVADWTASALQDTPNLTMIGHSLGTYVAAEASAKLKESRLIALDPAYPANTYDVDGVTPNRQSVRNFSESAENSVAFVVADDGFQLGLAGDNQQAGTAHTSLVTRFDGLGGIFDATEAHNAVIDLYADLSRYLSPNTSLFDDLWQRLERDRYNNSGDRSGGRHEGVAYADRDEADQWRLEWIDGDEHNIYFVSDALSDAPDLDDDDGIDTVVTLVDLTLEDEAEHLILGGQANLNGMGNQADNELWGNRGHNQLMGHNGADSIRAGAGVDELRGNAGADVLWGNQDDDMLRGGNGNDVLRGGAHDDVLWGDRGDDHLFGGSGSDVFVLAVENGTDTIHDVNFRVDGFGLSSGVGFRDLEFIQQAEGTQIRIDGDSLALVLDASSTAFRRSHFEAVA